MNKAELETKIRRQAGNLIYCWIQNSDKQYLGRGANIIISKRDKQIAYLKGLAYATTGVNEADIYKWIEDEIANTYQKIKNPVTMEWETATPKLMIAALMMGETINGKNWQKGVYGCKKIGNPTNYVEVPSVSYDTVTSGRMEFVSLDGNAVQGSSQLVAPNYDLNVSSSYPSSVSIIDQMDNIINTYDFDGVKNYNLSTVSNGTTTIDAKTGKTLTVKDQTYWENIANIIGQVQGLISTFAEMLSGITAAEALTPMQVQDGWVTPEEKKKSSGGLITSSTGLILGGSLIASAFLLNNKKK